MIEQIKIAEAFQSKKHVKSYQSFLSGVRFAEAELKSVAMEFGKFVAGIDTAHYFWCDIEKVWRTTENDKVIKFTESELFAKFEAERAAK